MHTSVQLLAPWGPPPCAHAYGVGHPHHAHHPTSTHVSREPGCPRVLADSIPPHVVPGTPVPLPAHQLAHTSPCRSCNLCLCRQRWRVGRCLRRGMRASAAGTLARLSLSSPGCSSCGRGQGMRGSVQAAGRKPEPNNRGKWRNWKKTQWQHSQHRWLSAEWRDSWEKGPQHSAESPQLCPWGCACK